MASAATHFWTDEETRFMLTQVQELNILKFMDGRKTRNEVNRMWLFVERATAPPRVTESAMLRPVIRFSERHVYSDKWSGPTHVIIRYDRKFEFLAACKRPQFHSYKHSAQIPPSNSGQQSPDFYMVPTIFFPDRGCTDSKSQILNMFNIYDPISCSVGET